MAEPQFDGIDRQLNTAADGRMRVFGIRRCGQHAVINWILRNSGRENHVFLNSCTMQKSAIRTCGQSEINGTPARKAHFLKGALEKQLASGSTLFVLISYEAGYPPALYTQGDLTNGFANTDFSHEVLVTRSFVNWLPSFIRLMRLMLPASSPEALEISNGIVFEMMRYKAHLMAAADSAHQVISYDHWFADTTYRRARLKDLGLPEIDNTLGDVQKYGGGSSFTKWTQPASELDVLERWKSMIGDPYARQFLALAADDNQFLEALAAFYPKDLDVLTTLLA